MLCEVPATINLETSKPIHRELAGHQEEAVKSLDGYFSLDVELKGQSGLLVMPTGSGKTFTSVYWLLKSCVARGYRVVWLVHRQELVDQAYNEFYKLAPLIREMGKKKLKLALASGSRSHLSMSVMSGYDINVISVASAANKYGARYIRRMLGKNGAEKCIVIIDEAHHAVSPSYERVIEKITRINPNRILLGLTATPTRMQDYERKKLYQSFHVLENRKTGKGTDKGFIYEATLARLLLDGFLARPIYIQVDTNISGDDVFNLTDVERDYFGSFGELPPSLIDKMAQSAIRNRIILNEYLNNQEKYGKTLIFALNQEHAKQLAFNFQKEGVACDYVVTSKPEAQKTIEDFKNNKFKVLINVQILTEGSDVPDIQTVFLTRQTNSDSLLMQMVGRGLRGEAAGGTKEVYIVDFHDKWDSIVFWMNPQKLDIFSDPPRPPKGNNDIGDGDSEDENKKAHHESHPPVEWKVYMALFNNMKKELYAGNTISVFPIGWYLVIDEDGQDNRILVYDVQMPGYTKLEKRFQSGKAEHQTAKQLIVECFDVEQTLPSVDDIQQIVDFYHEEKRMPDFFEFEARDLIDTRKIAEEMKALFSKDDDQEMWLKKKYTESPVIQDFYRNFYFFKKAVFSARKTGAVASVDVIDEREEYHLVENAFDLNALLDEVIHAYPFMNRERLEGISWSKKCYRQWLGMCYKKTEDSEESYTIQINRILSSPDIDVEVIKYLIYHEMLHKSGYWNHDSKFRDEEWSYPNSAELDGQLNELRLRYKMDDIWTARRGERSPESLLAEESEAGDETSTESVAETVPETSENEELKSESQETEPRTFKFCRSCGNKLPSDANFCDKCGNRVNY